MKKWLLICTMVLAGCGLFAGELPAAKHAPGGVEKFTGQFEKVATNQAQIPAFGYPPYLVTAGDAGHYNSMTLGWGTFGILWQRPVANIYVRTTRYTNQFLAGSDLFTLSWYPAKHRPVVIQVFGRKSGRDTDKEAVSGFTPVLTPEGAVTYAEADLVLVCRKLFAVPLDKKTLAGLTPPAVPPTDAEWHIQYTAEVIAVYKKLE
ncbi:MAG: flavin reductase [Victivallales bacterium]|nr:flavin reductase [Victivallales bacterium]